MLDFVGTCAYLVEAHEMSKSLNLPYRNILFLILLEIAIFDKNSDFENPACCSIFVI